MDESKIARDAVDKTLDLLEQSLAEQGFAHLQNIVPDEWLHELHAKFQTRSDDFKKALIGKPGEQKENQDIRGDWTLWLEPNEPLKIFSFLNELKTGLNRRLFLGINNFECHLASYPPGMGYETHVDNPLRRGTLQNSRRLTFLTYFNQNWIPGHGGELELFSESSAQDGNFQSLAMIPPKWNHWVFFLSEKFPHRVLPCTQTRESLSGWFRHDRSPS